GGELVGRVAIAVGPLEGPRARETGQEEVARAGAGQRAAAEVDGLLEGAGDDRVAAAPVDGQIEGHIVPRPAERLAPLVRAGRAELDQEDVVAARAGQGCAEGDGVLE